MRLIAFQPGTYYLRDLYLNYDTFKFFMEEGRYKIGIFVYEKKKSELETVGNYSLFFDVNIKYTKYPTFGKKE